MATTNQNQPEKTTGQNQGQTPQAQTEKKQTEKRDNGQEHKLDIQANHNDGSTHQDTKHADKKEHNPTTGTEAGYREKVANPQERPMENQPEKHGQGEFKTQPDGKAAQDDKHRTSDERIKTADAQSPRAQQEPVKNPTGNQTGQQTKDGQQGQNKQHGETQHTNATQPKAQPVHAEATQMPQTTDSAKAGKTAGNTTDQTTKTSGN